MPLVLSIRQQPSIPLEVDSVRLEAVRRQATDAIKATLIQHGNQKVELGEFFNVSGTASDDSELVWEGDCSRVKWIGAKLTEGRIRVEGHGGMHLGAEMTGGEMIVSGNVTDWCGAEVHGGRIHVHGSAGNLVGAVYRGGRRGMTGGEILIDGDAGDEVGQKMRRGTIAVGGNTGAMPGFGMLAGSILIAGECGMRPGAGMRRGTIAVLGSAAPSMLPTFTPSAMIEPTFLRLYLRHLLSVGFPLAPDCLEWSYRRYCGDALEGGRGEILVRD